MSQGGIPAMSRQRTTVGELVAAFLEECGVRAAFGVISIHNMPILDAFGRRAAAAAARGKPAPIRFVPARSEPGAASSGRVAPMICRTAATAESPSTTIATTGPEVMKSTTPRKNGFSRCAP